MLDAKYYRTELSPPFINEKLSIEQWRSYLADYPFPAAPKKAARVILHHTYSPTVASWAGLKTMRAMQSYYKGLGWSSGPHIFIGPDGIWLATPMNKIGIHANAGNSGAWGYSIGVEMVGNYDNVQPSGYIWEATKEVVGGLLNRLNLQPVQPQLDFHRTYNPLKSCPGKAVQYSWVANEIKKWQAAQTGGPHYLRFQVTADSLNIRQGPTARYPIAGILKRGETFLSDGTKDEGSGLWLHLADGRGFVHSGYTKLVG